MQYLVDAMPAICAAQPDVRFLMVGDGSLQAELRDQVRRLNLADIVHFVGFQEDPRPFLGLMDVFVLPSHREGFPRSVMEAAAMGVPVVATDIRGCREAVTAESGILVPIRNVPELTAALCGLVSDPARRSSLSSGATRLARDQFDVRRQVEISLDVYARGLRRAGKPSAGSRQLCRGEDRKINEREKS